LPLQGRAASLPNRSKSALVTSSDALSDSQGHGEQARRAIDTHLRKSASSLNRMEFRLSSSKTVRRDLALTAVANIITDRRAMGERTECVGIQYILRQLASVVTGQNTLT
jgi:hypothetical protein